MYDSGVTISQLIGDVKREVDVVIKVPSSVYADALNYVHQMVYGEIVQERGLINYGLNTIWVEELNKKDIIAVPNNNNPTTNHYKVEFDEQEGLDKIRFEDITQVFFNGVELLKTELRECMLIPDTYSKYGEGVVINVDTMTIDRYKYPNDDILSFLYIKRPPQVRAIGNGFTSGNVMLPNEFIELAKSYMRGAAYKSANEDALAAKWISDFNNMLETFKVWMQAHR